jgi:glycosyltransferase involved in cell wall biosynthesis
VKILFCNRDMMLWDGGDKNKIKHYIEHLSQMGYGISVTHSIDSPDFSQFDVIHAFHLGHDFSYKFYLEAKRLGKRFIISPIYFPAQSLQLQYRREMVEYASNIAFLSKGEQEAVLSLYPDGDENRDKIVSKSYIIPNGIDPIYSTEGKAFVHPNCENGKYVLCVGRLDSRKNQLRLAKACQELDIPLLLVGGISESNIVEQLQVLANKWDGLWWEPEQPPEKLVEAYRGAHILACPSTLEMWPNVVAEGGIAGCNLVVSKGSFSFSDLDGVFPCTPFVRSIKGAVQKAYDSPKRGYLKDHFAQFTWEKTAYILDQMYREVA